MESDPVDVDLVIVLFGENACEEGGKPFAGLFGEVALAEEREALVDHEAEEEKELVDSEIIHLIPHLVENVQERVDPLDLSLKFVVTANLVQNTCHFTSNVLLVHGFVSMPKH